MNSHRKRAVLLEFRCLLRLGGQEQGSHIKDHMLNSVILEKSLNRWRQAI